MTIQSAYPQSPRLWKLLLISVVASFCALLPSDALIAFSHWFHASEAKAQGILSWYLLGYACGPLLYGPLSNFYGRKKHYSSVSSLLYWACLCLRCLFSFMLSQVFFLDDALQVSGLAQEWSLPWSLLTKPIIQPKLVRNSLSLFYVFPSLQHWLWH